MSNNNNNSENTIRAGRITGNPLCGLCDRVCIEVQRIFDGCISRQPSVSIQLILTDLPVGFVVPFTFISAIPSGDAVFNNLTITPLQANRARLRGEVIIPLTVTFSDATGRVGTASSSASFYRDVILNVPARSIIPYNVLITGSLVSEIGTFVNETTVNIICCVVTVIKIAVKTDILVPTYGYAVYPDCEHGTEDLCDALLNLPIFPPLD